MRPHIVVDIGNTRVKWGLCAPEGDCISHTATLPDDVRAWEEALAAWRAGPELGETGGPLTWVLSSVQPRRCQHLKTWLEARGNRVFLLSSAAQLPLRVGLEHPDRAGIDRLLNAVAATSEVPPGRGAVLIDAGSAVTVDWLDEEHVFRGGSIFPGLDLMAEALHRYTALLPAVSVTLPIPELPAGATIPAMQVGIFLAVSGGIREAVRLYAEKAATPPRIFFCGGQAPLLVRAMNLSDRSTPLASPWTDYLLWPEQTLVGVLRSAESFS